MMLLRRGVLFSASTAFLQIIFLPLAANGQTGSNQSTSVQADVELQHPAQSLAFSLGLPADTAVKLNEAVAGHNYIAAEKLLLSELQIDQTSPRAARLLAYLGSVYFLNHDYLSAAVAWKKSDAMQPIEPSLQFSLAMAYVQIGHPAWATPVLEKLSSQSPANPLYPYWLGRLDYDAQHYADAIAHIEKAVELDPKMARAYDNLGLCYFAQNDNDRAIINYQKAIALNNEAATPSAVPYLNLAIAQQSLNQSDQAETNIREALRIDPKLAPAHYRLASILEDKGKLQSAIEELSEAAKLDDQYAEPHLALARIYKKLNLTEEANEQVHIYQRLHAPSEPHRQQ